MSRRTTRAQHGRASALPVPARSATCVARTQGGALRVRKSRGRTPRARSRSHPVPPSPTPDVATLRDQRRDLLLCRHRVGAAHGGRGRVRPLVSAAHPRVLLHLSRPPGSHALSSGGGSLRRCARGSVLKGDRLRQHAVALVAAHQVDANIVATHNARAAWAIFCTSRSSSLGTQRDVRGVHHARGALFRAREWR